MVAASDLDQMFPLSYLQACTFTVLYSAVSVIALACSFPLFGVSKVDKICWLPLPRFGDRLLTSVSLFDLQLKPVTHYPSPLLTLLFLPIFRNLLPISHVCTEDGEKPMVLLPFMAWGNLKLFLRQCKLAEANNPQVRLPQSPELSIPY